MNDPWFLGAPVPPQLLTAEHRARLEVVRDQLYQFARVTFDFCEDGDAAEVQMGLCFESMALQIDQVLDGLTNPEPVGDQDSIKH
jgi:hypothetical protein